MRLRGLTTKRPFCSIATRRNASIVSPSSPGANYAGMRWDQSNFSVLYLYFYFDVAPLSATGLPVGKVPVFLKVYFYKDNFNVFFFTNLQSGAAVQRQKKTQDTVNRAESAGTDCIICSENVATVTFNPCGHKVTCSGKTNKIVRKSLPLCGWLARHFRNIIYNTLK